MKYAVTFSVLAILLAWSGPTMSESAPRTLVMVAAYDSPFKEIAKRQARLAFLAVPTRVDGTLVKPILNATDPLLHEVFLQKTIYLSDQHYQRQVLAQVFRSGGTRPLEAASMKEMVDLLVDSPDRVSYMWKRDARNYSELKILLVVWQGFIQ